MALQPQSAWDLPPTVGRQISFVSIQADGAPSAIARDVAQRLRQALAARGQAVLHVSGGKSPVALFNALRGQLLDWSRVQVSLADERCLPMGHADSNATLVQAHLLQGPAAHAKFVPLVPQRTEPLPPISELARHADQALRAMGPADVLILGLGSDGHTASIFPTMAALAQALDDHNPLACMPVESDCTAPQARYARVTQTLAHLLSARHIVLPVAGADKQAVLRLACQRTQPQYPISFVLHQSKAPVAVWICP